MEFIPPPQDQFLDYAKAIDKHTTPNPTPQRWANTHNLETLDTAWTVGVVLHFLLCIGVSGL